MALEWSEPAGPNDLTSFYDHIVAETPLGRIVLEWKGWNDDKTTWGQMPWDITKSDSWISADTPEEAKLAAQQAWDRKALEIMAFVSKDAQ